MNEHGRMIRVALADDQRLLREGLRIILEATPDLDLVGEAADGVAATELASALKPDVILMDIRMPGRDGIAATEIIRRAVPETRVLLLTTYDMPELLVEGLRAGASGFLLKDCSAEELTAAVRAVARGQVLLQTASAAQLLTQMPSAQRNEAAPETPSENNLRLTGRERDVLQLITEGRSNGEIAANLVVSEATVKTHVHHIFAKLGARDRAHAVALAHQLGLA